MDNVTHTLFGLALARSAPARLAPLTTATLVIGANLPDADVFGPAAGGMANYLEYHRGLTHAAVGIAAQIPLLAGGMCLLGRLVRRPTPLRSLLAAAAVGLISHPLLDLLNTYGVRPWLPFDGRWYYGDVAFIVDPWLWLLFGGAAALGGPGDRRDAWGWGVLAGVIAALLTTLALDPPRPGWRLPLAVPLLWIGGAALLARWRYTAEEADAAAARRLVGLALAYLILLTAASRASHRRALAAFDQPTLRTSTSPLPGVPWQHDVVVETTTHVARYRVDLLSRTVARRSRFPKQLDHPALIGVRGTREHRAWRIFARHPFVRVRDGVVELNDARYAPLPIPSWCTLRVPIRDRRGPR